MELCDPRSAERNITEIAFSGDSATLPLQPVFQETIRGFSPHIPLALLERIMEYGRAGTNAQFPDCGELPAVVSKLSW